MAYTIDLHKWQEFERYDLKMIPTMVANGWNPDFDWRDKMHQRTYPDPIGMPAYGVGFMKEKKHTWSFINRDTHEKNWKVADLIDGNFQNHRSYISLEEILKHE